MLYFTLFVFVLLVNFSNSKIVKDNIEDLNEEWLFVTRFCFLSQDGAIEYKIDYPEVYGPYKLLLYYDTEEQWPAVYGVDSLTCNQKTNLPYIDESNGQSINLDPVALTNRGNCSYITKGSEFDVNCQLSRSFSSARQRWWYVVISRCNETIDYARGGKKGIVFNYEITMTNGEGLFFKHFSADEFYILQVDISFLLLSAVLLVISIICAVSLSQIRFYHTTYKLYMASLSIHNIYMFFITLMYGLYANDGVERGGFKTVARFFEIAAYLIYILVLILMAKGFTITRGKIKKSGVIKIVVFLTLYTFGFIILYVFEARFMDPGKVLYTYQSPAGYALIAMRGIAWVWFCYGIFFTLKHYPEKKKFYVPFFLFFTIWFWAGPIVIIIANFAMAEYIRATIVNGVQLFLTFLGYLIFLLLTLPCCVNTVFPFHIRTTQINVLPTENYPHEEEEKGTAQQNGGATFLYGTSADGGNNNMAFRRETTEFSHSNGPTSQVVPNGAPNFADLFLTSNTYSSRDQPTKSRTFGTPPDPNSGFADDQVVGKPLDSTNNPFVTDMTTPKQPEYNSPNGTQFTTNNPFVTDRTMPKQPEYNSPNGTPFIHE